MAPGAGVIRTRSQNSRNRVRNVGNYLIGLKSWKRMGGVIRPPKEQEWLKRGRITPAVAVVIGAQDAVFTIEARLLLSAFEWSFTNG